MRKITERWYRRAESRLYRKQEAFIKTAYGKRAADNANYGWGVSVDEGRVCVETKVYLPDGHMVLTSVAQYRLHDRHDWTNY